MALCGIGSLACDVALHLRRIINTGRNMDDQSQIAKDASAYIMHETGVDVTKEKEVKVDEHGRIMVDTVVSKKVDHIALANEFIKLVGIVPGLPLMSRKVMMTRMVNPGIRTADIGAAFGLLSSDVLAYEREGVNRITDYIRKQSIHDAAHKFNMDSTSQADALNLNMQGKSNSLIYPGDRAEEK